MNTGIALNDNTKWINDFLEFIIYKAYSFNKNRDLVQTKNRE